jgi:hypothetical protein
MNPWRAEVEISCEEMKTYLRPCCAAKHRSHQCSAVDEGSRINLIMVVARWILRLALHVFEDQRTVRVKRVEVISPPHPGSAVFKGQCCTGVARGHDPVPSHKRELRVRNLVSVRAQTRPCGASGSCQRCRQL